MKAVLLRDHIVWGAFPPDDPRLRRIFRPMPARAMADLQKRCFWGGTELDVEQILFPLDRLEMAEEDNARPSVIKPAVIASGTNVLGEQATALFELDEIEPHFQIPAPEDIPVVDLYEGGKIVGWGLGPRWR